MPRVVAFAPCPKRRRCAVGLSREVRVSASWGGADEVWTERWQSRSWCCSNERAAEQLRCTATRIEVIRGSGRLTVR